MEIPSDLGMFVYNHFTSIVTNRQLDGMFLQYRSYSESHLNLASKKVYFLLLVVGGGQQTLTICVYMYTYIRIYIIFIYTYILYIYISIFSFLKLSHSVVFNEINISYIYQLKIN